MAAPSGEPESAASLVVGLAASSDGKELDANVVESTSDSSKLEDEEESAFLPNVHKR